MVISKEATSPDPFVHVHQDPVIEEITEVSLLRPVDGRYVTIRLPGHDKQLVLCEVDVLGGNYVIMILLHVQRRVKS